MQLRDEEKVTGRKNRARIPVPSTPGLSQGLGPAWWSPRTVLPWEAPVCQTMSGCSMWRTREEPKRHPWPKMVPLPSFPFRKCQDPQSRCLAHRCSSQPPRATLVTCHCPQRPEPGKHPAPVLPWLSQMSLHPLQRYFVISAVSQQVLPELEVVSKSSVSPLSSFTALSSLSSKLSRYRGDTLNKSPKIFLCF